MPNSRIWRSVPRRAGRVREGEGAQYHGIEEAEERGVGADTEGERAHGDGGEGRGLAEDTQGVADVLFQVVDQGEASHVAAFFFSLCGAAQGAFRRAASIGMPFATCSWMFWSRWN